MSELPLLLLTVMAVAAPLQAQDRVPELRATVARLEARRARLAAMQHMRDSLARSRQHLVVLGTPPHQVATPEWAAAEVAPRLATQDSAWRARFGPLISRLPAETVIVAYPTDTMGWSREASLLARTSFVDRVVGWSAQAAHARIARALPADVIDWIGRGEPLRNFAALRVDAIVALSRDSSGLGDRCLRGDVTSCRTFLERDRLGVRLAPVRQSFLDFAMDQAGPESWGRLVSGAPGAPTARIAAATRIPLERSVADWNAALRRAEGTGTERRRSVVPGAFLWVFIFAACYLGRAAWHRA